MITTHHDIRGRGGRPGRHIWPRSHSGLAVGRGEPDDLGSPAGGAWRARSETGPTPPPAMILKSSQGIRLKSLHGSTAGGMWWLWQPVQTSTGSGEADQPRRAGYAWQADRTGDSPGRERRCPRERGSPGASSEAAGTAGETASLPIGSFESTATGAGARSPPRRVARRGSSQTVFREGEDSCGPGDPSTPAIVTNAAARRAIPAAGGNLRCRPVISAVGCRA